jgi:phage protein D
MSDLRGKAQLAGARLEFDQFSHDVYVLMYMGELSYLQDSLRTGAPVQITVESEHGTSEFLAYVHHIGVTSGHHESGKVMSTLYCVGSSYPFKRVGNSTWSNKSIAYIVEDIAKTFSFASEVDSDFDFEISSYVQGNKSYWQVLRELAIDYGALLKVEGTTLRFLKPAKAIKSWSANAPVLTKVPDQGHLAPVAGTPFTQFSVTSGELMTVDHSWQAKKVVHGVDIRTGQSVYSEGTPDTFSRNADTSSPFDHLLSTPVSSFQEARAFAEGAANRDRYPHSARVLSSGNPFVVSDKPVFIQGIGNFTGIWTVRKAYHDIQLNGVYTMTLDVGNDGLGASFDSNNQAVSPTLFPTRDLLSEDVYDLHNTSGNYFLHQASVIPLSGMTGSQYVAAQWKSRES